MNNNELLFGSINRSQSITVNSELTGNSALYNTSNPRWYTATTSTSSTWACRATNCDTQELFLRLAHGRHFETCTAEGYAGKTILA